MVSQCTSKWTTPEDWSEWVEWLMAGLHGHSRWRLPVIMAGLLLARGRRTVTSWIRAAGIEHEFRDYYYFVYSVGLRVERVAERLLVLMLRRFPGKRVLLALDDTPTCRYGPHVEGAGLHHNPTSGPDDHRFIYGHIWVTLAWVVRHPLWHAIAMPLWARLYVKKKDVQQMVDSAGWTFQTKLELAAGMIEKAADLLHDAGRTVWVVMDGAFAYRPLLKPALAAGVVVVSRLRKDAALRTLPPLREKGSRGCRRKYGRQRIWLARRAASNAGWENVSCCLYGGRTVVKQCKTFLATYHVTGGVLRVVLVREEAEWSVFFCTDPNASVRDILEAYADRSTIEQMFADLKQVWGTSQQQVRNLWSNLGAFHLNLWSQTLVDLWSWDRSAADVCDRRDSPWDDPSRRPSHADRRRALRSSILQHEFNTVLGTAHDTPQIKKLFQTLTKLAN